MESKTALRKSMREICRKMPVAYRLEAAKAAAVIFSQQAVFKRSQHIACYLAIKDEFDAAPIIETIWAAKKICYLPVLKEEDKTLRFVRYVYGDALHLNQYAILEPTNIKHDIAPANLDLVMAPLIAFDTQGHRLGTGGGYYDRTFAFVKTDKPVTPIILGLGYQAQEVQALPADSWDVQLASVITEKQFISF